jgi:hypothetical protein
VQALVRVRLLQINEIVQTGNQLRGVLSEIGVVMAKGHHRLQQAISTLGEDPCYQRLPAGLRDAIVGLRAQLAEQVKRVRLATEALAQAARANPACGLLRSVPGLGPINAAGLSVALEVSQSYRNARAFAASLRLVPRQWQTADKQQLRGIAKQGASDIRRNLVLAGQSLLTMIERRQEPLQDRLRPTRPGDWWQARTPFMACEQRDSMLKLSLAPEAVGMIPATPPSSPPCWQPKSRGHQQTGYMQAVLSLRPGKGPYMTTFQRFSAAFPRFIYFIRGGLPAGSSIALTTAT